MPTPVWQMTLVVSVPDNAADGGQAYNRLVAGMDEAGSDGFDPLLDIRAFLAGPVEAFFAHAGDPGYDLNSDQLWQDIRAGGFPKQWAIDVVAAAGRTVTVSWVLPTGEVSCESNQFVIEDSDGQLPQTDLCAAGSMNYVGDGLVRHFVVRVS